MITSLAYLGLKSPKAHEWPEMATRFWGAMVTDPGPDGSVRLKFDEADWRLQIHPGERDEGGDERQDVDVLDERGDPLGDRNHAGVEPQRVGNDER